MQVRLNVYVWKISCISATRHNKKAFYKKKIIKKKN